MEQTPHDPQFYRYPSTLLGEDHLVTLVALSDQCQVLASSIERATFTMEATESALNDYGHVLDLASTVNDEDHPILIGTPAEADLAAGLVRSIPRMAPLTSDEREFLRRSYARQIHVARSLATLRAGVQPDGLLLPADGAEILHRWQRWLSGGAVGEVPHPTHLTMAARLLATLLNDNITMG